MLKISVTSDVDKIRDSLPGRRKRAKYALTEQVVKDSNYFIPKDTGNLEGSSLALSDYEAGKAIWGGPYARRLYHNPQYNFSKDVNPNAQGLWYEAAKGKFGREWQNIVKERYK